MFLGVAENTNLMFCDASKKNRQHDRQAASAAVQEPTRTRRGSAWRSCQIPRERYPLAAAAAPRAAHRSAGTVTYLATFFLASHPNDLACNVPPYTETDPTIRELDPKICGGA